MKDTKNFINLFLLKNNSWFQLIMILLSTLMMLKMNAVYCSEPVPNLNEITEDPIVAPIVAPQIIEDPVVIPFAKETAAANVRFDEQIIKEFKKQDINADRVAMFELLKACDSYTDLLLIESKIRNYELMPSAINEPVSRNDDNSSSEENPTSSFKEKLLLFLLLSMGIILIYHSRDLLYYFYEYMDIASIAVIDFQLALLERVMKLDDNSISLLADDLDELDIFYKYDV